MIIENGKTYSVILLAAGLGRRMEGVRPKQLMLLRGKPLIIYSLEVISSLPYVKETIVTVAPEFKDEITATIRNYGISKNTKFVIGGETRQESVFRGIQACSTPYVLIHEAARPLVDADDFNRLVDCPAEAAILGSPIPYTVLIKGDDNWVEGITNRDKLINVQLPHKFPRDKLLECHVKAREHSLHFTEDASLYSFYGGRVKVLAGKPRNIKITIWEDLVAAEAFMRDEFDE